jgi:hypothetical protein
MFERRDTVGQVADSIVAALEKSGYVERSFFRTKLDGVALVTRIERINDDGTPSAPRWPAWRDRDAAFNLERFLRGLFYVDRGRYRVIVFILQDKPFSQSTHGVTDAEARAWLRSGANILPREIAGRPYGENDCTALIYEFASDGKTVHTVDSPLTGRQHLDQAGITASLAKAN